eukprot:TRINITY_DN20378_c0_g1_i1.p2 TRINITY_DN20378_c0_g1~~TRINITY_DN20378_c0_g1_i1.p2  ORF type:complete len:233 (+),score=89.60 TRINITY_DN20378_c0_g1_i1:132-830(+)
MERAPRTAHEFARGFTRVSKRDVLRLYKELMKAAMTISNPKMRVNTYDSIRYEFKARRHFTDEFAVLEALTRGMSDLETLRDGRTHPFLYMNEDGIVQPPLIEDPNVVQSNYIPGPFLALYLVTMFAIVFFIGGGLLQAWFEGRSAGAGYAWSDIVTPHHKGLPVDFMGHKVPWKYDPPTGPEIRDFRSKIMAMREEESFLEAELLDREAKILAIGLRLQQQDAAEKQKAGK